MASLYIPILLGTARQGRQSELVAKYVLEQVKTDGRLATELIDVRDFLDQAATNGMSGEKSKKWSEIMRRGDGLVIVSPEYNHGYPGELKLMLDEIYEEYNRKPVAIVGTGGRLGGGRMVEMLRLALIELQMVPIRNAVYFSYVSQQFDEAGAMKDSTKTDQVKKMLDELIWYANALKVAREKPLPPQSKLVE